MVRVPTRTTLKRSGWSTCTTAGSGAGSTWVVTAAAEVSTSWRPHATNTGNPIASSASTRWTGGRCWCRGTGDLWSHLVEQAQCHTREQRFDNEEIGTTSGHARG